jgi:putative peptidoglycan lipid II flippase
VRLIVAVLVMSAALLGMMYVMPEWSLGTMPYRLMRLMAVVASGWWLTLPRSRCWVSK